MDTGGCYNYYAYSDLFANVKKWIDEDYIDYVVPQVYVNLKSVITMKLYLGGVMPCKGRSVNYTLERGYI